MLKFSRYVLLSASAVVLISCEQAGLSVFDDLKGVSRSAVSSSQSPEELPLISDLGALIEDPRLKINFDAGFESLMLQAVDQDPAVLEAKNELAVSRASLRSTKTGKDTQISAVVLAGIEDVTDETLGIAAILKAKRLIYDGGMLDAKIDADMYSSKAVEQAYLARRGERALSLASAWIELERYQSLKELIDSRLAVLDPLLVQLERVAASGVGDVSQVASAQRIVSSILVAEIDISVKYDQARIAFINGFGHLPDTAKYDALWVSNALPESTSRKLAENSPGVLAGYWMYRAAESSVVAVKAQDDFNVGFEVKLQRPFGGSDANSDESVGFAVSKQLYRGDQLKSQVERAEATAQAKVSQVIARYRKAELNIIASRKIIESMRKAIKLARSNAESSRDEIDYLKKQLIIGGSTLESVLSAEARFYEAESKEIGFIAQRRQAEATIIAIAGFFEKGPSSK